jgi:hypothetical protein
MVWIVAVAVSAVTVTVTAGESMPRKVALNADNMEILRLDIMAMEVRLGNYVKEHSDRVVAALDRHRRNLTSRGRTSAGPMSPWLRLWTDRPPEWTSWRKFFIS